MVVGECGLGKTTLINTLFHSDLYKRSGEEIIDGKTTSIQPTLFELEEQGVKMQLTVVDTPGFGDQLNRMAGFKPLEQYIDAQYEQFHQDESSHNFRQTTRDTRIHALLYFIAPGDQPMKEMDLTFIRQFSLKTNVVPIIAKADTMTAQELQEFKQKILYDLIKYDVKYYPSVSNEEREVFTDLFPHMPFSVIGCDNLNSKVRSRKYRWGTAEVENPAHCDFIHLRELLLGAHTRDMIETTHDVHYYNYRKQKLRATGRADSFLKCDDQFEDRLGETKKAFTEEVAQKEQNMRQAFFIKVKEKETVLREAEEAFNRKKKDMMAEVESELRQLEIEEKEMELNIQRAVANKKIKGLK